jgi:hypothetical protein
MKIKRLILAGLLMILGYFAVGLFNYALDSPQFLWQRELMIFCSFLIVYSELAWLLYKSDKRNWLWLGLCGFCLLLIPIFSILELPHSFWLPCFMAALAVYGYFVNKQATIVIIILAVIAVAVLIIMQNPNYYGDV